MSGKDSLSFLDHLAELRSTLLWSLGFVLVATVAAWFFSDQIVDALMRPTRSAGQDTLYFQAPMEAFLLKLKASLAVGVVAVFPLILYRVYMFVMPGLLPKEKRVVTPLLTIATLLFYVGVSFCFLVLLPMVIRFALGFATESLQPWLTAGSYFDMAWRLCLAFGLFFELPIVVFVLSWVGVVHPRTLLRGWRYALLLILVASAGFTPPDLISQVLLGGPVMLLYIGSVLISLVVRKRRDAQKERERAEDDDPGPEDDGGGSGRGPGGPDDDLWDVPPTPRAAEGSRPRGRDPGDERSKRPESPESPSSGPDRDESN